MFVFENIDTFCRNANIKKNNLKTYDIKCEGDKLTFFNIQFIVHVSIRNTEIFLGSIAS